jgi:hypothetical protein
MTSSISRLTVSEASTLWSFERSEKALIGGTVIGACCRRYVAHWNEEKIKLPAGTLEHSRP